MRVSATISTRDRYFTTLPLAIASVAQQTFRPTELVIFDDGEHKDLRECSPYPQLLKMLNERGIDWKVLWTPGHGQVKNHQWALMNCKSDLVWRLDDDNIAEPDVLKSLVEHFEQNERLGAAGSLVWHPGAVQAVPDGLKGALSEINLATNIQWCKHASPDPVLVEHLYSTFVYRREAGLKAGGYPANLSTVGHREETTFTHKMFRAGYKLLVDPKVITWHLRDSQGGIRPFKGDNWEHDEALFHKLLVEWNVQANQEEWIVLDNGLGDHLMFLQFLPRILKRHEGKQVVIACCYPEVFEGQPVRIASIAQAIERFGNNLDAFNAYKWAWDHNWKDHFSGVFERMYLA